MFLLLLGTIATFLLFKVPVHPPDGTIAALSATSTTATAAATLTAKLLGGNPNSCFSSNEGLRYLASTTSNNCNLVKLLLKRARINLGEHVSGTKTLNAGFLRLGFKPALLLLISPDLLVDLFKGKTCFTNFRVFIRSALSKNYNYKNVATNH